MDLDEINNIKSSVIFNKELDNFLNTTQIIPNEIIIRFYEAYSYDQATTVNWVIGKLKILNNRIKNNETFEMEGYGRIDKSKFHEWVKTDFPNIYQNVLRR